MRRLPADLIDELAAALREGRPGGDAWMRRAVDAVTAAGPAACLGHYGAEAAWLASRGAMAARVAPCGVEAETAAAVLSGLTPRPMLAAAYAGALSDWPGGLARLVSLTRERVDGSGPLRLTRRSVTPAAERVGLALEAASVVRRLEGQTAGVLEHFVRQAEAGVWRRSAIDHLSAALAGLGNALLDARREALAGRTFRLSAPHEAAAPHADSWGAAHTTPETRFSHHGTPGVPLEASTPHPRGGVEGGSRSEAAAPAAPGVVPAPKLGRPLGGVRRKAAL